MPTTAQRITAAVLALLWTAGGASWAESAGVRSQADAPAAGTGSAALVQQASDTIHWLAPLIAPTPLPRLFPNKGYLVGGPRRVRFEVERERWPQAPLVPGSLEQLYHYTRRRVDGKLEPLQETPRYTRYRLTFPTLLRNRFSAGGQAYAEYYEPKGRAKFPVVLVLPHLAGDASLEQFLCRGLASTGIGALIIFGPYYRTELGSLNWMRASKNPTDLVEVVQLMRDSVTVVRQSVDWLQQQPNVQSRSFGIVGVSLGGIIAALTAGLDDRLQFCEYLLAGGDMNRLMGLSHLTKAVRSTAQANGFGPEDLQPLWMLIDPISVAARARTKPTLMINALFDLTVPRDCTLELWRALGRPRMVWLPTEHATAMLLAPYLRWRTVRYFQQMMGAAAPAAASTHP